MMTLQDDHSEIELDRGAVGCCKILVAASDRYMNLLMSRDSPGFIDWRVEKSLKHALEAW